MRKLARTIANRTTDLIAIALILFVGLTMGRSVIEWWNTDPDELMSINPQEIVDQMLPPDWESGLPVEILMGKSPVKMERLKLVGNRTESLTRMAELVYERSLKDNPSPHSPDSRERQLLASIRRNKPWKVAPDGTSVFVSDGPLAVLVGTRGTHSVTDGNAEKETDVGTDRVVCWGLAFPSDAGQWTGYLFRPGSGPKQLHSNDWRDLLPDDTICTLSLATKEGFALLAFEGSGTLIDFQSRLQDNLEEQHFEMTSDWHRTTAGVQGSFRGARTAVVQFRTASSGRIHGLIHISVE